MIVVFRGPFVPPMEGTDARGVFTLRNITDMDRIRAAVDHAPPEERRAVVIGAGAQTRTVSRSFSISDSHREEVEAPFLSHEPGDHQNDGAMAGRSVPRVGPVVIDLDTVAEMAGFLLRTGPFGD